MRPDLEDFDDLNELDNGPRSKAMAWLVLGVALCGFTSLAYYAYHSGSQSMRDASIAVVEADSAPIKAEPADPQGEQFPNKDKTIYEAIAADDASNGAPHVEKLLPEAEQPTVPQVVAVAPRSARVEEKQDSQATTFVNAAGKGAVAEKPPVDTPIPHATPQAAPVATPPAVSPAVEAITPLAVPVKPVAKAPAKAPAPPAAVASAAIRASDFDKKPAHPSPSVKPAVETVKSAAKQAEDEIAASEDASSDDAAPVDAVAEVPSASAPSMVNVKPVTPGSKPTSEVKDAQAKAAAAKPVVVESGAGYKVQLGAFKSEAEAAAQWKKIASKNGDVLHGAPVIVKADLPNGTFYRLRASGFASADAAKAACAKLASRSQACFPAGK